MSDPKQRWSALAAKELRHRPVESLTWQTLEGIPVQPLYTEDDIAGLPHLGNLPGEAPYTRGVKATMYAGPSMDHPAICGLSPRRKRANAFYRKALGGGAAGGLCCFRSGDASRL
jgi:methylmalonyl-CoA mutase